MSEALTTWFSTSAGVVSLRTSQVDGPRGDMVLYRGFQDRYDLPFSVRYRFFERRARDVKFDPLDLLGMGRWGFPVLCFEFHSVAQSPREPFQILASWGGNSRRNGWKRLFLVTPWFHPGPDRVLTGLPDGTRILPDRYDVEVVSELNLPLWTGAFEHVKPGGNLLIVDPFSGGERIVERRSE